MWTHSRSSGQGTNDGRGAAARGDVVGDVAAVEAHNGVEATSSAGASSRDTDQIAALPAPAVPNGATRNGQPASGTRAGQPSGLPRSAQQGRSSLAQPAEGPATESSEHSHEAAQKTDPTTTTPPAAPDSSPQPNTTGLDVVALRESMLMAEERLDDFSSRFYSLLFAMAPEVRELFGASMELPRSRLSAALIRIVGTADDREQLVSYLEALGRDHRKFGVIDEHYAPLGGALVLALRDTLGRQWTDRHERAWVQAYDVMAMTMAGAARRDAVIAPPWWDAEVVYHRRILDDMAIIQVRPHTAYPYRPGQYAYLTTPRRPKLWRAYSMASAPRDDGLLEFHVRTVGAGWVSSALVWRTEPGEVLHLGAPQGHDLASPRSEHDLLCIAGGTGIAPILASLQELEQRQDGRRVHVFYAGRDRDHLYALPHLESIGVRYRRLTVVPVVSPEGPTDRSPDLMGNIVSAYGDWRRHSVYVAGPSSMVETSLKRLREQGLPEDMIVFDDYGK